MLPYDVVFHFMSNYLNQGYSLFVDNYILASDLFAQKTHVTGTLDKSQKSVPYRVIDCYGNLSSKTRPGMYVRDGCAVYSVWKDTNYLLTKWPMADLFLALIRYIS